jgi:hypothetical protein
MESRMENKNKQKDLTQQQLHFFSIPSGRGNTLLDYDLIPRFIHERAGKRLPVSTGESLIPKTICIGEQDAYEIHPAIIMVKDKEGEGQRPFAVYPGTRESIIEDCLIYFSRNGEFSVERGEPGYTYDGRILGVCFTLNQLRTALKGMGKEYRLDELKEGLNVLLGARYTYINHERDGECALRYVISELKSIPNPNPSDKMRSDRIVHVTFDSRVSSRILDGHYRTYNDICAMSMRSPVARYLYKQFTHFWQNANLNDEAGSLRSVDQNETILASGSPLSKNPTKSKSKVLSALSELAKSDVIQPVDENFDVVPVKAGRKVVDVRFMVRPTKTFIKQQIEGYQRLQKSKAIGKKLSQLPASSIKN